VQRGESGGVSTSAGGLLLWLRETGSNVWEKFLYFEKEDPLVGGSQGTVERLRPL
jgi:hypothetical protein